jgi:hypothetical protein
VTKFAPTQKLFIDPPNVNNPVVDGKPEPMGALWSAWLVRLAAGLNSLPSYADSGAAKAGGLHTGQFFRNGAVVCVVNDDVE